MDEADASDPRIRDASDHSLLISFGAEISAEVHGLVREAFHRLSREPLPGVVNLHPAYASVLVSYDLRRAGALEVRDAVRATLAAAAETPLPEPACVEIPVRYGGECGPDLDDVARSCRLDPAEVIRAHAGGEYVVYFLGFSPGFPYLGGMPSRLATPRRATPRTRVPAGSVAIGGGQTGVYPLASPGGWQLIGRTPLPLFDPGASPPARLALGDRVRFSPIAADRFAELAAGGAPARPAREAGDAPGVLRVVEPGFQTTLQDLGRPGHAHLGVSASGAADPLSLRVANSLVGNPEGAAGLEMTLAGGTFAFTSPAVVAVTGSDFGPALDGVPLEPWTAAEVGPGQTLACGPTRSGARCYLAVRGGVVAPAVLGSLSTHLTTGLGGVEGRTLRRGDVLAAGGAPPGAVALRRVPSAVACDLLRRRVLRVTRGAQWASFGLATWEAMLASTYVVSEDSNRMGLRLRGAPLSTSRQGSMLTEGVSLGALQVPPDGAPILSFVEHQTTGGYPQIACVIAADLHRAGQLRPRDEVRFEEVSVAAAGEILASQESLLAAHLGASR